MCDPVSIGGALAVGAGTVMKSLGNRAAERAAAGATSAEVGRQAGYRDQAFGIFDKTLGGFERPKQDADLRGHQDKRAASGARNVSLGDVFLSDATRAAPKVITDAYERGAAASRDYGAGYAGRRGAMEGYGDLALGNATNLSRSGGEIDRFRSFARGSAGVLPLEMQAAQGSGSTMRGIGEVFQAGGHLASLYGFTRPAPLGLTPSPGSASWIGRNIAPSVSWWNRPLW